jgi:transposase-like protein
MVKDGSFEDPTRGVQVSDPSSEEAMAEFARILDETHQRFDASFKVKAVGLAQGGGRSLGEVSKLLGVPIEVLKRWVDEHRDAGGGTGALNAIRLELAEIRLRNSDFGPTGGEES